MAQEDAKNVTATILADLEKPLPKELKRVIQTPEVTIIRYLFTGCHFKNVFLLMFIVGLKVLSTLSAKDLGVVISHLERELNVAYDMGKSVDVLLSSGRDRFESMLSRNRVIVAQVRNQTFRKQTTLGGGGGGKGREIVLCVVVSV